MKHGNARPGAGPEVNFAAHDRRPSYDLSASPQWVTSPRWSSAGVLTGDADRDEGSRRGDGEHEDGIVKSGWGAYTFDVVAVGGSGAAMLWTSTEEFPTFTRLDASLRSSAVQRRLEPWRRCMLS